MTILNGPPPLYIKIMADTFSFLLRCAQAHFGNEGPGFLAPETTVILRFLDSEILKMDKKISGSRNRRNGAISGSRNRRKGRQILYRARDSNISRFKLLLNSIIRSNL